MSNDWVRNFYGEEDPPIKEIVKRPEIAGIGWALENIKCELLGEQEHHDDFLGSLDKELKVFEDLLIAFNLDKCDEMYKKYENYRKEEIVSRERINKFVDFYWFIEDLVESIEEKYENFYEEIV